MRLEGDLVSHFLFLALSHALKYEEIGENVFHNQQGCDGHDLVLVLLKDHVKQVIFDSNTFWIYNYSWGLVILDSLFFLEFLLRDSLFFLEFLLLDSLLFLIIYFYLIFICVRKPTHDAGINAFFIFVIITALITRPFCGDKDKGLIFQQESLLQERVVLA